MNYSRKYPALQMDDYRRLLERDCMTMLDDFGYLHLFSEIRRMSMAQLLEFHQQLCENCEQRPAKRAKLHR